MTNSPPPSDSPFLSVTEAAELLRLSPRAVQHRISSGKLPAYKMPGRTGAYVLERAVIDRLVRGDLICAGGVSDPSP